MQWDGTMKIKIKVKSKKIKALLPFYLLSFIFYLLFLPAAGWAKVERLVVGRGGTPWKAVAEQIVGLEDTTVPGSLQPRELHPWENILIGPRGEKGQYRNLFGFDWAFDKTGKGTASFQLGVSPRFWRLYTGDYEKGASEFIDGDPDNALGRFFHTWTFDFGLPLPINRVVFYPPEKGMGRYGELFKNMFPRAYEVSAALEPSDYLLLTEETTYHPLDIVLEKTYYNNRRVAEITFPTKVLRFLRFYFGLVPNWSTEYTLSEIEVYGEGFPPKAWYISEVIDMKRPVNLGRIFWGFSRYRKEGAEAEAQLVPNAPVTLSVETQSGDDDTPVVYHVITEIGREREVTQAEYMRALDPSIRIGPRPGNKGSVTEDVVHWSFWSSPYRSSGEPIESPDGRRYLQLKFSIESSDIFAFGRLDSIAIEYSPLLVDRVVGEVALKDQPRPPRGVVEVSAGTDTVFTYDLRATFLSSSQVGFDAIRVATPSPPHFVEMEMGEPLSSVKPDSVWEGERELVVYFSSNRITRASNRPIRLTFRAAVFGFNTYFVGDVFEINGDNLPQSIDPGDANEEVSTDDIQVFASIAKLEVLPSLQVYPPVITPNGDGRHDRIAFSFTLLGTEGGEVEVSVYDIAGKKVRRLVFERRREGLYTEQWDGAGDDGSVVPPGIYFVMVSVSTNAGTFEKMRRISVVY